MDQIGRPDFIAMDSSLPIGYTYGDRADYRSLDLPSVLEISGTETASELARRHREKVAQALENPFGLDAYVVVCAFSSSGHHI